MFDDFDPVGAAVGAVTPIGPVFGGLLAGSANSFNNGLSGAMQFMDRPSQVDPASLKSALPGLEKRLDNYTTSPWAMAMNRSENLQQAALGDQAVNKAAGQAAVARSNLAGAGGLTAGARERLAQSAARTSVLGQNDIARQGMVNRANIGAQDYKNKMANDSLWARVAIEDANNYNNTLNNNYSESIKAWAANNAANAGLAAQKKDGIFGLGIGGIF